MSYWERGTKLWDLSDERDSVEYQERLDAAVKRVTEYVDNVGICKYMALVRRFPEWEDIMAAVVQAAPVNYDPGQIAPSVVKAHGFRFENETERRNAYADMCDGKQPLVPSWSKDRIEHPRNSGENERIFNNQDRQTFRKRHRKAA